jgi:hypothetical protein
MVMQIPSFTIQLKACQCHRRRRALFPVLSLSSIYCTKIMPSGAQAVATLNGFHPSSRLYQFTSQVVVFVAVIMQRWIVFRIGVCIRRVINSI